VLGACLRGCRCCWAQSIALGIVLGVAGAIAARLRATRFANGLCALKVPDFVIVSLKTQSGLVEAS